MYRDTVQRYAGLLPSASAGPPVLYPIVPLTYEIDTGRGFIASRGQGVLRDEEIASHAESLHADPDFSPTYVQVIDLSGADCSCVSANAVRKAARRTHHVPGARRAIVATNDVCYGLARMFAIVGDSDGQSIAVFGNTPSALAWLEVEAR